MPDVPYPKPKPPTRGEVTRTRLADSLSSLVASVRSALTGDANGRIRRPALYVIAAISIGIAMSVESVIPSVVALVAVMLLALTDAVVEL